MGAGQSNIEATPYNQHVRHEPYLDLEYFAFFLCFFFLLPLLYMEFFWVLTSVGFGVPSLLPFLSPFRFLVFPVCWLVSQKKGLSKTCSLLGGEKRMGKPDFVGGTGRVGLLLLGG